MPRIWIQIAVAGLLVGGAASTARARSAKPHITMAELLRQELSSLRQLRAQRVELRRVRMGRRAIQGELLRIYAALGEVKRRQKGLQKTIDRRRRMLRARVRALYRLVRATSRWPLLDSRRARVPADGRDVLLRIVRRDMDELRHLESESKRLVKELDNVRKRRGQAMAVLKDLARRRDRIQARVARAKQEVAELRHRRRNHNGPASEFNRRTRALEKTIMDERLAMIREVTSFDHRRGKLVRPVPGMIVKWFGAQRTPGTKTTTRFRGIEISALPNWKVRAPAPGKVRFAGSVPGYRQVLIIDHDEGYLTVLGNLDQLAVKVGDKVTAGRAVAHFTRRGHAVRPVIYFELRRGGKSINPIPWIQGGLAELRARGPRRLRRRRRRPARPSRPATTPQEQVASDTTHAERD